MKIKTRIKRAIVGLFREELLEWIKYNHNRPLTTIPTEYPILTTTMKFETLVAEITIDRHEDYERQLQHVKEKFSNEVLKYIHVEEIDNLVDPKFYRCRNVKLVLRVQI